MPRKTPRTLAFLEPRLLLALAGPLLMGALPGLRYGLGPTLRLGPSLLVAVVATVVVMGPALYLLWGLTGARGSFQQLRGALVDALTAAGRVQLGFAPVVLLLAATVAYRHHALLFALAGLVGGLLVGTVRLWRSLSLCATRAHTAIVVVPWLAAALLMGGRLVVQLVSPIVGEG